MAGCFIGLTACASRSQPVTFACPSPGPANHRAFRFESVDFPQLAPPPAPGPDTVAVYGYVRSNGNSAPLEWVQIWALSDSRTGVLSDSAGTYLLKASHPVDTIRYLSIGHLEERIPLDSDEPVQRIDVEMVEMVLCLGEVALRDQL